LRPSVSQGEAAMHPWQKRARECEFCSTEHAHQTTIIDAVKVPCRQRALPSPAAARRSH
jgi:hypothetical protein